MLHIKNSSEVTSLFTGGILSSSSSKTSAKLKGTDQSPCLFLLGEVRNSAVYSVVYLVLFETSVCWHKCLSLSLFLSAVATMENFSLDDCKPTLLPCVCFSLCRNLLLTFSLFWWASIIEPNRMYFTSFLRVAKCIKISSSSFFCYVSKEQSVEAVNFSGKNHFPLVY